MAHQGLSAQCLHVIPHFYIFHLLTPSSPPFFIMLTPITNRFVFRFLQRWFALIYKGKTYRKSSQKKAGQLTHFLPYREELLASAVANTVVHSLKALSWALPHRKKKQRPPWQVTWLTPPWLHNWPSLLCLHHGTILTTLYEGYEEQVMEWAALLVSVITKSCRFGLLTYLGKKSRNEYFILIFLSSSVLPLWDSRRLKKERAGTQSDTP